MISPSRSALLAAALVVVDAPVRAEEVEEVRDAARQMVRKGNALLEAGDCRGALALFKGAKGAVPTSYRIDLNIATTLECLGWRARAANHLSAFLDRADPATDGEVIRRARVKLAELIRGLSGVSVTGFEPHAQVLVDGELVGETPRRRPFHLDPGRHTVRIEKAGRTLERRDEQLAPDQLLVVDGRPPTSGQALGLAPQPLAAPQPMAATPAPARRRPIYKRWWFWTAVGAALVGSTVAIIATQTGGDQRMPSGEGGARISLE